MSIYIDSSNFPIPNDNRKEIWTAYNDLSECTLDPAERVEEAGRIIEMLTGHEFELSTKELTFINGLQSSVSVKQLFWLRDIKDRVLG